MRALLPARATHLARPVRNGASGWSPAHLLEMLTDTVRRCVIDLPQAPRAELIAAIGDGTRANVSSGTGLVPETPGVLAE